eukprot:3308808-Rhodomonas_salina.1
MMTLHHHLHLSVPNILFPLPSSFLSSLPPSILLFPPLSSNTFPLPALPSSFLAPDRSGRRSSAPNNLAAPQRAPSSPNQRAEVMSASSPHPQLTSPIPSPHLRISEIARMASPAAVRVGDQVQVYPESCQNLPESARICQNLPESNARKDNRSGIQCRRVSLHDCTVSANRRSEPELRDRSPNRRADSEPAQASSEPAHRDGDKRDADSESAERRPGEVDKKEEKEEEEEEEEGGDVKEEDAKEEHREEGEERKRGGAPPARSWGARIFAIFGAGSPAASNSAEPRSSPRLKSDSEEAPRLKSDSEEAPKLKADSEEALRELEGGSE